MRIILPWAAGLQKNLGAVVLPGAREQDSAGTTDLQNLGVVLPGAGLHGETGRHGVRPGAHNLQPVLHADVHHLLRRAGAGFRV